MNNELIHELNIYFYLGVLISVIFEKLQKLILSTEVFINSL